MKVRGTDETVSVIYDKTGIGFPASQKSFGIGPGYLELKNTATASLPSSPNEGAFLYDSTLKAPTFHDGTDYQTLLAGNTSFGIEEGTWTAVLLDASEDPGEGQAVTSTNTVYTRLGRMVFLSGEIAITNLGSLSGSVVRIGGFPYTAASDAGGLVITHMANATIGLFPAGVIDGGTSAVLVYPDGAGDVSNVAISDLSTSTTFKFHGQYIAA